LLEESRVGVECSAVAERRQKSQLLGDFLREIAVLIIVFYPIEAGFNSKFDWSIFSLVAVLAFILLWLGMILEGSDDL
jgi:hypothetical protein